MFLPFVQRVSKAARAGLTDFGTRFSGGFPAGFGERLLVF